MAPLNSLTMMNPELKRLLWVECTRARVLFIVTLALSLQYLAHALADEDDNMHSFRLFWFGMATAVWGSHRVIESITEEHQNNTWYWQMMLPLSPWQIASGKFFGALALPWLGGSILLFSLPLNGEFFATIAISLFANAIALLMAFILSARQRQVASAFLILLFPFAAALFCHSILTRMDDIPTIIWYGSEYHTHQFFILSVLFYTAWAFVAAWQFAKLQKQITITPILWMLFIVSYITHFYGFSNAQLPDYVLQESHLLLFSSFALFSLTYTAAAFVSNRDEEFFPFIHALSHRAWHAVWRGIPAWLVTLVLYFTLLPAAVWVSEEGSARWYILTYSFYMLRDIAILLLFTLKVNARMPIGITLIYLAILYFLIPELLEAADIASEWYSPAPAEATIGSAANSTIQALIATALLYHHRLRPALR